MKTDWTYKVKCRNCGRIADMWHSNSDQTSKADFKKWALAHSTFPITRQCQCNNGSILFHDLISYTIEAEM